MTQPKPKPVKDTLKDGDPPVPGNSKDSTPPGGKPTGGKSQQKADGAFDVWLNRGLHQLYDDIAREPVPDELLRLIEDDKQKKK